MVDFFTLRCDRINTQNGHAAKKSTRLIQQIYPPQAAICVLCDVVQSVGGGSVLVSLVAGV